MADAWVELLNSLANAEVSPRRQEMRRLAGATRVVIERLVATEAPVEVLSRVADLLERASAEMGVWPQRRRYEGFAETGLAGGTTAFPPDQPDFFEGAALLKGRHAALGMAPSA